MGSNQPIEDNRYLYAITVKVYSAKDLAPKDKGSQYSIVFGIGRNKHKTCSSSSVAPTWNEQATFYIEKSHCKIKFSLRVNDVKCGYLKLKLDQAQLLNEDIVADSWHNLKSKRHKEQTIGKLRIGLKLSSEFDRESMSKSQGTNARPQFRQLITRLSTSLISKRSTTSLDSLGIDSSEACNQIHERNVEKSPVDDINSSNKRTTLTKSNDNSNSSDHVGKKDTMNNHDLRTKDSLNDGINKNRQCKPLLNQSGTTSEDQANVKDQTNACSSNSAIISDLRNEIDKLRNELALQTDYIHRLIAIIMKIDPDTLQPLLSEGS